MNNMEIQVELEKAVTVADINNLVKKLTPDQVRTLKTTLDSISQVEKLAIKDEVFLRTLQEQ